MEAPFIFGKIAINKNFTNRKAEQQKLIGDFNALINVTLISPRRWGKSSLVEKAATEACKKNNKLRFCFLDAFNIRTEEQFYQLLATEVLKVSASKIEILMENAKTLMGKFLPRLSFSPDNQNEFSLSLDWEEVKKHPDDILNLPEKLAAEKGWKLIICMDEFQNIATFGKPLAFQKKLRSHWQKHQHVAYCLYGSKRHMLMDVFTNPSMPFYKFGDIIFLEKIKKDDWVKFITRRFRETEKSIPNDVAALIADLTECHPYYVQQLSQQSWLRSEKNCTKEIVIKAHLSIVDQLGLLFQSKTDELSNSQINFLHALVRNVQQLSSKETLDEFDLGTSGNVVKIKKALVNKEIVDVQGSEITIMDPMYKSWLKTRYFKIK